MRDDTWSVLEEEFANLPILRGGVVPLTEVEAASATLGLAFPQDYSEFLHRFGAAMVGAYPIFGLRAVEPMGSFWSVTEVNRHFRADGWPGVGDWVIVSMDQAGNPVGITKDGEVWISDHGKTAVIAPDFEQFLRTEALGLAE